MRHEPPRSAAPCAAPAPPKRCRDAQPFPAPPLPSGPLQPARAKPEFPGQGTIRASRGKRCPAGTTRPPARRECSTASRRPALLTKLLSRSKAGNRAKRGRTAHPIPARRPPGTRFPPSGTSGSAEARQPARRHGNAGPVPYTSFPEPFPESCQRFRAPETERKSNMRLVGRWGLTPTFARRFQPKPIAVFSSSKGHPRPSHSGCMSSSHSTCTPVCCCLRNIQNPREGELRNKNKSRGVLLIGFFGLEVVGLCF